MTSHKHILKEGDEALLKPILHLEKRFYFTVGFLLIFIFWGAYAYSVQWREGLGVTGMNQPVSWGFYITNFVFLIGISHAGTLISAILRIAQAEWRRPITRIAEVITVMVLFVGAGNILVDLGRPDRLLNILMYGRFQSPLVWDMISVNAYLTASIVYLYLPLIPDIAIIRDRLEGFWYWPYRVLSLGWQGNDKQKQVLNRAIAIMAVLVIPIAVSVHTVVSFVFSMTLQPMWHSTIFGPYFVVGAIFSGIAVLLLCMVLIRKIYGFERYLQPIHFNYLGLLLLIMSLLWFYFTFVEYLTGFYGGEPDELKVFMAKISGDYAVYFWAMVIFNFVVPVVVLFRRKTYTILRVVIASITVLIGMWLERFIIIVPTLSYPRLELPIGSYIPTWVEWGETAGSVALFILAYVLFTKFFPIISIWEIHEGREEALEEAEQRIRGYLPLEP